MYIKPRRVHICAMNSLPISVEAYLTEAGFSPTELLIMKNLLQSEGFSLRQLASKTGKSTGVLDQAMKKLLRKKIVSIRTVNSSPLYVLESLQSIVCWVEKDTTKKREELEKRYQDFESFVASVSEARGRPEVEHFTGETGIKRAYCKLLDTESKELLAFLPIACKEEEDSLCDFKVQYFRERHRRGIFLRVLTQNTSLARRYQTRDCFEYRKTLLLSEGRLPLSFEKIVTDGMILCVNHAKQEACLIRYSDFATAEAKQFEMLWQEALRCEQGVAEGGDAPRVLPASTASARVSTLMPSISTRTLSSLREFFLSKKSIATFFIFAVIAGGVTFVMYKRTEYLNLQRLREQVISIATTGALQFDPQDLEQLHTVEDISKPEYSKVIAQLNAIRRSNTGVKYVYIMRPTEDSHIYTFVADADSLHPFEEKDVNGDGIIDDADHLSPPGELYDVSLYGQELVEALIKARERPIVDTKPFTDQWGVVFGATAPIKDIAGKTVAMLWVDRSADDLVAMNSKTFAPLYYFLVFFFLFIFIRFLALNRSFLADIRCILHSCKIKGFSLSKYFR